MLARSRDSVMRNPIVTRKQMLQLDLHILVKSHLEVGYQRSTTNLCPAAYSTVLMRQITTRNGSQIPQVLPLQRAVCCKFMTGFVSLLQFLAVVWQLDSFFLAGKKIRIPFTFRQQSDTKGKEPVCSTSTLTSRDVAPIAQPAYQIINACVTGPSSCSLKFIIGKKDVTAECKARVPSIESMYRALIEEWAAPSIVDEREVPDDQEWLFGTRQQDKKVPGRLQTETNRDELCPSIYDLWPRAHYLPDAEIFALGYTVPFWIDQAFHRGFVQMKWEMLILSSSLRFFFSHGFTASKILLPCAGIWSFKLLYDDEWKS